jgi:hypothetical protein
MAWPCSFNKRRLSNNSETTAVISCRVPSGYIEKSRTCAHCSGVGPAGALLSFGDAVGKHMVARWKEQYGNKKAKDSRVTYKLDRTLSREGLLRREHVTEFLEK